jgi:hypothetical protein
MSKYVVTCPDLTCPRQLRAKHGRGARRGASGRGGWRAGGGGGGQRPVPGRGRRARGRRGGCQRARVVPVEKKLELAFCQWQTGSVSACLSSAGPKRHCTRRLQPVLGAAPGHAGSQHAPRTLHSSGQDGPEAAKIGHTLTSCSTTCLDTSG